MLGLTNRFQLKQKCRNTFFSTAASNSGSVLELNEGQFRKAAGGGGRGHDGEVLL